MMISSGYKSHMMKTSVAEQHYYNIPGRGNLPPVVILHGIGTGNSSFYTMFSALRRHTKRIIAPEAPGHGFSLPPTVDLNPEVLFTGHSEIINSQLEEPAFIFGNSLGGGVAIEYALRFPEKVKGLILSSPAGAALPEKDFKSFLEKFRIDNTEKAVNFVSSLTYKPFPFVSFMGNDVVKMFNNKWIKSFLDSLSSEYFFTPEKLAELKMPILFIWGKSERLMLPQHLEYFKANLPEHTIIDEPEDFAHCPYLDRPFKLVDKMVDFMNQTMNDKN